MDKKQGILPSISHTEGFNHTLRDTLMFQRIYLAE